MASTWYSTSRDAPTIAYSIGLVLIAGLATAIWVSSLYLISAQEKVGAEVNVAGRQRMLSQRIAMIATNAERFEEATGKDARQVILGCADLMERAHALLIARDLDGLQASASEGISCKPGPAPDLPRGAMSAEIEAAFFAGSPSLDQTMTDYLALVRAVATSERPLDSNLGTLLGKAYEVVPQQLNAMVGALQREGEHAISRLQTYKTGMWVATLILLVLEVLLIFRPMNQVIQRSVAKLRTTVTDLEEREAALTDANRQILESIEYARKIQEGILPDVGSVKPLLGEVSVVWEPLHVVSGDYLSISPYGDEIIFFLADCTGHGVPGAFMTMVVASALERELERVDRTEDPAEILHRLDSAVRARLRQDSRADIGQQAVSDDGFEAAVCIYHPQTRELRYAGAGIPLILAGGGTVEVLKGDRVRLGYRSLHRSKPLTVDKRAVGPGDRFYLMTDGAPDHIGGEPRRAFGRRRIVSRLQDTMDLSVHDQLEVLQQDLESYLGDEPRRDDLAIIAARPVVEAASRTSEPERSAELRLVAAGD
jgi:serine phosphatase RsbU (regulator of sigma subunit)